MSNNSIPELSIIICCYNSEDVIRSTLESAARQMPTDFLWNVVLIDNNCTDSTVAVATKAWESFDSDIELRILRQPEPGLASARKCGVYATPSPIIIFCDDDNQLCDSYVSTAKRFMDSRPDIVACGGWGEAETIGPLPEWFDRYKRAYAVGKQAEDRTEISGYLYGAGIILRRNYLKKVYDAGFEPLLSGRKGGQQTAGDDGEMQEWFDIFDGGKRYYLPELKFKHYLKPSRLTWSHLTKLYLGFGAMAPVVSMYRTLRKTDYRRPSWFWLRSILKFLVVLLLTPMRSRSVRDLMLFGKKNLASIRWLLSNRKMHPKMVGEIIAMRNIAVQLKDEKE